MTSCFSVNQTEPSSLQIEIGAPICLSRSYALTRTKSLFLQQLIFWTLSWSDVMNSCERLSVCVRVCVCVRAHSCVRPGREEGTSCSSSSGVQWPQMAFDLIKEHSLKTKQLSVWPAATVDEDEVTHTHTNGFPPETVYILLCLCLVFF